MPVYDYKCLTCGCIFEELVTSRQSDAESVQCPRCGSRENERLLSAPAIGNSTHSSSSGGCGHSGFS